MPEASDYERDLSKLGRTLLNDSCVDSLSHKDSWARDPKALALFRTCFILLYKKGRSFFLFVGKTLIGAAGQGKPTEISGNFVKQSSQIMLFTL